MRDKILSSAAAVPGGPDRAETVHLLAADILPAVRGLAPTGAINPGRQLADGLPVSLHGRRAVEG